MLVGRPVGIGRSRQSFFTVPVVSGPASRVALAGTLSTEIDLGRR